MIGRLSRIALLRRGHRITKKSRKTAASAPARNAVEPHSETRAAAAYSPQI